MWEINCHFVIRGCLVSSFTYTRNPYRRCIPRIRGRLMYPDKLKLCLQRRRDHSSVTGDCLRALTIMPWTYVIAAFMSRRILPFEAQFTVYVPSHHHGNANMCFLEYFGRWQGGRGERELKHPSNVKRKPLFTQSPAACVCLLPVRVVFACLMLQ